MYSILDTKDEITYLDSSPYFLTHQFHPRLAVWISQKVKYILGGSSVFPLCGPGKGTTISL